MNYSSGNIASLQGLLNCMGHEIMEAREVEAEAKKNVFIIIRRDKAKSGIFHSCIPQSDPNKPLFARSKQKPRRPACKQN